MTNQIGVDLTANVTSLDQGFEHAEKRTREFTDSVKKTSEEISSSSKKSTDALTASAKQTEWALRGIPAQITDIVVGLQSGQAPLTVFLQQGGQLKDMFGGVGNAARALGGYLIGLINPFSLAATAVGVLTLAYQEGSSEHANFTKSLVLSGNAAKATADQLMSMSMHVAASTGATRGSAAETLNVLAASGKVSSEIMERASKAAIDLNRVGAAAVADTVKEFVALGADPVNAVLKLDDQYHFLTGSVYAQIKALSDQGRETEAAKLAQITYVDAIEGRIPSLANNLGLIEKAWKGIWSQAKSAWDSMLGIGRQQSIADQIASIDKEIEARKPKEGGYHLWDIDPAASGSGEGLKSLYQQRATLEAMQVISANAAKAEETLNAKRNAGLFISKLEEQSLSNQEKLRREIIAIETNAALAGTNPDVVRTLIDRAKEKYADKRSGPAGKTEDPELASLIAYSDEMVRLRKELDAELKSFSQQHSGESRASALIDEYRRSNAMIVERIEREADLATMNGKQRVEAEALYKVEDEGVKIRERILRDLPAGVAQTLALAQAEEELALQKGRVLDVTRKSYDDQRSFEYGWKKAYQSYSDDAENAAKTAETAFSKSTSAIEGAIRSLYKNGKVDINALGDAFINMLIDVQMQSLKTNVLAPMMQSGMGWLSGLFGGSYGGLDTGAGSGFDSALWGLTASANGNVFSGAPDLHQYVNTVQTTPRVFGYGRMHAFAKGGIFAEEKPEAVMPLERDSSGRLGVISHGSGSNVTINVIESPGNGGKRNERSDGNGGRIIDIMVEQIEDKIAGNVARGSGSLAPTLERTYNVGRQALAY